MSRLKGPMRVVCIFWGGLLFCFAWSSSHHVFQVHQKCLDIIVNTISWGTVKCFWGSLAQFWTKLVVIFGVTTLHCTLIIERRFYHPRSQTLKKCHACKTKCHRAPPGDWICYLQTQAQRRKDPYLLAAK